MVMRIIFLRHGESTANIDQDIISGVNRDAPLTQTGRQQVQAIARRIQKLRLAINYVYVSPTIRTKQTAQLLFPCHPRAKVDERLIELSQGHAEGTRRSDSLTPNVLASRIAQKKDFRFTGGESMNQAALRLHNWVDDIRASHTKNDTVLVITHAMLTRSYVSFLLDWSFEMTLKNELDYCACVIIEIDGPVNPPLIRGFNVPIENVEA